MGAVTAAGGIDTSKVFYKDMRIDDLCERVEILEWEIGALDSECARLADELRRLHYRVAGFQVALVVLASLNLLVLAKAAGLM